MSPNPRSRVKYPDTDSGRSLRNRLNIVLIIVAIQFGLLIVIWIRIAELGETRPVVRQAAVEQTEHKSKSTESGSIAEKTAESGVKAEDRVTDTQQIAATEAVQPLETMVPSPIKVQVLNGCGVGGIAGRTAKWLKKNGYDVKDVGNADRQDYRQSKIIDRSGNLTAARELASLLGIPESRIKRLALMPKSKYDLTLIIGKDHGRLSIGR